MFSLSSRALGRRALPLLAALGAAALGACRGDEPPVDDAPVYKDSGVITAPDGAVVRPDGSTPPPPPPPPTDGGGADAQADGGPAGQGRKLASGELEVLSTLLDGTIIFQRYAAKVSVEAVSPTGGAVTVIVPDLVLEGADTDDVVTVIGGAVGVWTGVDADTGLGRLSVWTKATGLRLAADVSPIYELDASSDGARVAFVRGTGATAQLVTAPATLEAANVVVVQNTLGDGSAANPCPAFYTFVGQNLFSSTCSGTAITATARRTTPAGAALQIDTGLAPYFLATTATGDKVFSAKRITSTGTGGAAAVYSVGATAVTELAIEASGVAEGYIAQDGAAVVYRTRLGALKKANTVAPATPTELVPNGSALGILGVARDFKTVLSHKLAPGGTDGSLFDLQLSSVATPGPAISVVPTATALEFGFTHASRYVLWVPDVAAPAPSLKARAVGGGADVDLGAASIFLGKPDGTDGVVLGFNEREITVAGDKYPVVDYKLVDPTGAPRTLVTGVDQAALVAPGGKQLVFTQPGSGLFIRDIP